MTDSGYPKIIPLNESWAVQEFAPELIIFGSDGGGTAYAFDTRTKTYAQSRSAIHWDESGEARKCGDSFNDFLMFLERT